MRRLLLLLGLVALGCAGLPHPEPADVSRVQGQYPTASQASLERGRSQFVSRCSGCHTLPSPLAKAPGEWGKVVRDMSLKMDEVPQADVEVIEQFLVAISSRPASPSK